MSIKRKRLNVNIDLYGNGGDCFCSDSSDSEDESIPLQKKIMSTESEEATQENNEDKDHASSKHLSVFSDQEEEHVDADEEESDDESECIDVFTSCVGDGASFRVRRGLSMEEKQKELLSIETDGSGYNLQNKFLACLLWDIDFRFTLLPHQYEGVFKIAGIDMGALSESLGHLSAEEETKIIELEVRGKHYRREFCIKNIHFVKEKGMFLADEMGLGKTIQCIGGAILRSHIKSCLPKFHFKKCIVIFTPNSAVLSQWREALIAGGIDPTKIRAYKKGTQGQAFGGHFLLATKSNLMNDMMDCIGKKSRSSGFFCKLFRKELVMELSNLYHANKGREKDVNRQSRETSEGCIARKFKESARQYTRTSEFELLIFDESQEMKNISALCGMGSILLGMYSERSILCSGTPYTNSFQDIATQMMIMDLGHYASDISWWKNASENEIQQWRREVMLRREKCVLANILPPKVITEARVKLDPTERKYYQQYEKMFLDDLKNFHFSSVNSFDPSARKGNIAAYKIMMSKLNWMRMSLIHPILSLGRNGTILFSPTRHHLYSAEKCVFCTRSTSYGENTIESTERGTKTRNIGCGELIKISENGGVCMHVAHRSCLVTYSENGKKKSQSFSCPRCQTLGERLVFQTKDTSKLPIYCKDIQVVPHVKGIQASSKIQQVIDWVSEIPKGEKAIIYSSFKASLDILEGIFVYDLNIMCERFDGDISQIERSKALSRFKDDPNCKTILISLHAGGVGLNIVEANHVGFLDRWFNPSAHEQAEDRSHRLGQEKQVNVTYFDAIGTSDEEFKAVTMSKSKRASYLLGRATSNPSVQTTEHTNESGILKRFRDKHILTPTKVSRMNTDRIEGRSNRNHQSYSTSCVYSVDDDDNDSISSSLSEGSNINDEGNHERNGYLGEADEYLDNMLKSSDEEHAQKKQNDESLLQKGSRSFGLSEEEESSEEEEEPSKIVEDTNHINGSSGKHSFQFSDEEDEIKEPTFNDHDGYSSHADSSDDGDSFDGKHDMNSLSGKYEPMFDHEKYLDQLLQSSSNEYEFEQEKKQGEDIESPLYWSESNEENGHSGKYRTHSFHEHKESDGSLSLKKADSSKIEDTSRSIEEDNYKSGTQPINADKECNDFDQGKKSKKGKNLWDIDFG